MQMAGDFVNCTVGFKSLNDEENEDTFAKLAVRPSSAIAKIFKTVNHSIRGSFFNGDEDVH